MTDYSAQKAKSDCFEYGIAQGCDDACPGFCREYPEEGCVKCASIAEARKIFNCDCDGKPCCEGPITLEELIAKTQKNVKTWAKNKKNEMDKMYTANMAFIAAAPEMLEALEEVKEYIEHSMNYGILAGVPEFVESAIQKARGEENKPEDDLEEYLDGEPVKSLVDFLLPLLTKLNRCCVRLPIEYSQQWEEC